MSIAVSPRASIAKRSSDGAELERAAAHVSGRRRHFDRGVGGNQGARLGDAFVLEPHAAGHDQRLRLLARLGVAARDERAVEALARHPRRSFHSRRSTTSCASWRSGSAAGPSGSRE